MVGGQIPAKSRMTSGHYSPGLLHARAERGHASQKLARVTCEHYGQSFCMLFDKWLHCWCVSFACLVAAGTCIFRENTATLQLKLVHKNHVKKLGKNCLKTIKKTIKKNYKKKLKN